MSQLDLVKKQGNVVMAPEIGKQSDCTIPLVSIVTVVFNGEKYIEQAINSVISQEYENIEYVIIDGKSTDSTVDVIKRFEGYIDYWISEPDQGQSEAFAKAFKICSGDWITWLNADDILLPGAIEELVKAAKNYPLVECFTGNVIWTTADNRVIQFRKGEAWSNLLPKLGILSVYGPTTFFKKSLYERVEGVNKNLHYKMDTDLWWQFYAVGATFRRLDTYTWTLRLHEDAKMSGHNFSGSKSADLSHPGCKKKQTEERHIVKKNPNYQRKSSPLSMTVSILCKLVSVNYIESVYHTRKYKGHQLMSVIGKIQKA